MSLSRAPTRLPEIPSSISGDLRLWLSRVKEEIDSMPVMSYTSYAGGPNSNVTATQGSLVINIPTSSQTATLYCKHLGSGNTGWFSFATIA